MQDEQQNLYSSFRQKAKISQATERTVYTGRTQALH